MKRAQGTLTGFLDDGCTIKGEVAFSELLRVHGHVDGKVHSEDELLVGEGGTVEGEITVARLIVAGTVRGTVRVTERLVVHASGRVQADVHTPRLIVDEGGVVEGTIHMLDGARQPVRTPAEE